MTAKKNSGPKRGRDRLTSEDRKFLQYGLFDSLCRMVEQGCHGKELKRIRRQRAELEKKLGYEGICETEEWARAERLRLAMSDSAEMETFMREAEQTLRTALQKKLRPGEKLPVPDLGKS